MFDEKLTGRPHTRPSKLNKELWPTMSSTKRSLLWEFLKRCVENIFSNLVLEQICNFENCHTTLT